MLMRSVYIMDTSKPVRHAPAGSVFVVDDNAMLVELAATVLEAAGYCVNQFLDPSDALRAIESANPKPAVVVTDYVLMGMNGLELINCSHKIHPGLKTILVSGSVDSSITITHPAQVDRFLGKPYGPAQLQSLVAQLMQV